MATLNFNSKDVPSDDLLPAGEYEAHIVASEFKATKAGTGSFLELRVQILEESHAGYMVFDRLNLDNPNKTAVEIANRTLSSICKAVGVEEIEDSEELHGIPLVVRVVVDPARGDWGESNSIKKYSAA